MSEAGEAQKVPFRIGFEGVIEPARIPELIQTVSELATTQLIDVQFLDAEGEALSIHELLKLTDGKEEVDKGPTVSREEFVYTLSKQGVTPIMSGKAWGRLARSYNNTVEGWQQDYIAEFTDLAGPGNVDVRYVGRLYVDSLRERVSAIEAVLERHHSNTSITRICGGDVGPVTFGIWKTFLDNWQPDTSEAQ